MVVISIFCNCESLGFCIDEGVRLYKNVYLKEEVLKFYESFIGWYVILLFFVDMSVFRGGNLIIYV